VHQFFVIVVRSRLNGRYGSRDYCPTDAFGERAALSVRLRNVRTGDGPRRIVKPARVSKVGRNPNDGIRTIRFVDDLYSFNFVRFETASPSEISFVAMIEDGPNKCR